MDKHNLKILAVIPARAGSKGLPGKNIKLLGAQPLICYTIKTALKCPSIGKVVVSTDDQQIAQIARESGAECPFIRPKELAEDTTPLNPVIKHAMEFYDAQGWISDLILSLQPTNPFTSQTTIEQAIEKLLKTDCDSVVTVTEIKHGHPYRAKSILGEGRLENFCKEFDGDQFLNRQERPRVYTYTGAIYLRKRKLLQDWNGVDMGLGRDSRAIIAGTEESINIDNWLDFKFAEMLIKEKQNQ